MAEPIVIIAIVIALVPGLAIGWLLGARSGAGTSAKLDVVTEQRNAAIRDIEIEKQTCRMAMTDKAAAETALAALRGESQARAEAFEAQLRTLKEAKDDLARQFAEVGGKLLGEARESFIADANRHFGHAQERSEAQLKALLTPVNESIQRYDQKISTIEQQRTEAYGNLTGLIHAMREGQDNVSREAARLVNSLRAAPKARGRWGEQQLRNVLESCGLSEHADFQTEVSVASEDGRLRPDVIIRVPGGQSLVVDAKVSLNAYQDAFGATDDAERAARMTQHCKDMRAHVDALGRKAYWDQFRDAPDYVIMFVPGEHFLSAALEHDPNLWDFAFGKRVLLATPTNLIAIARTVAAVWRQEKMATEAKQIGALGKELYERLSVAAGHLKKVGDGINRAAKSYNDFASSFESRVLVTGRRLRDLNVETGDRELDEPLAADLLARDPVSEEARALPEPEFEPAALEAEGMRAAE